MKVFAALSCAGLIAGAGVVWFLSNPVVATVEMKPLQPSAAIPTFKPVPHVLQPANNMRPSQ